MLLHGSKDGTGIPLVNSHKIAYLTAVNDPQADRSYPVIHLGERLVHEIRSVRYWSDESEFGFSDPDMEVSSDDYSAPVALDNGLEFLRTRTGWPEGATGGGSSHGVPGRHDQAGFRTGRLATLHSSRRW